jgi:hypothetical protein
MSTLLAQNKIPRNPILQEEMKRVEFKESTNGFGELMN